MDKKIINLININVSEDEKIQIECIYKHDVNIKPIINLNSKNAILEYSDIAFSKEYNITKINVVMNKIDEKELKIKVIELNTEYDVAFRDNKDELISEINNDYIIYLKKDKISIFEDCIKIEKKKKIDIICTEIKKQIYCLKKYKKLCFFRLFASKKKKYYLFNDRIMYGDDNAEQLFKHINKTNKKMKRYSYFVLDKKSPKIKELKKYGKILKYGTFKHKIKYLNCRMVISSHASYYDRVYNPFNANEMRVLKDLINKKFVFLQHGVINNDLHKMLNRPQIIADLFITTTNKEYEEILTDKYLYNDKIVKCTGLARFDKLKNDKNNIILVAPTWRAYLTDAKYGDINKQKFEDSEFYKTYKSLIENKELLEKIKQENYEIYFLLHPAFVQFKNEFYKYNSELVKILTTDDITYAELFRKCSIFITDYSSTHFDVAFLKKAIIYYQFDKEKFYDSHYDMGYFDYEKDGFGDVAYNEAEIVEHIISYIDNNCNIKEKYKEIIEGTFKYLDSNNSERIYKEIKSIENGNDLNYRFNNVH